ncbi:DUF2306 domain-containing protein [Dyadobacter subterraneus]|uniref:DUF2306 domain-containing protein n=1 Tax=Dyadobacter subterraneus TaxID=2773304 RepID=A0ABR9W7Z2_9BACT|nr:DUF2306 domain-containing protein [Dyadobacter subterraneus]MBE9461570.1 DUF2306 domain-containing protein [Dyadobacter subterraneus]
MIEQSLPKARINKSDARAVRITGFLLVSTVWVSAGLFGLYILAFYAAALYEGNMGQWNNVLPGLYQQGELVQTSGIGIHFASGGIILLLGSIQLMESVRVKYSFLHKWIGRIYVLSCLLAAIGGLVFIVIKGTIGGTVMDIGFSLYGILMLLCGIETYRHAVAGRFEKHSTWALRLYALAIGSWLYRMDYGFWIMLTDGLGHLKQFNGPFDNVMSFFFYIPNLIVAELFIRSGGGRASKGFNWMAAFVMLFVTGFLLTGTYFFAKYYWLPAIFGLFINP